MDTREAQSTSTATTLNSPVFAWITRVAVARTQGPLRPSTEVLELDLVEARCMDRTSDLLGDRRKDQTSACPNRTHGHPVNPAHLLCLPNLPRLIDSRWIGKQDTSTMGPKRPTAWVARVPLGLTAHYNVVARPVPDFVSWSRLQRRCGRRDNNTCPRSGTRLYVNKILFDDNMWFRIGSCNKSLFNYGSVGGSIVAAPFSN